jgi:nucleoside recognition membrane protein YjiH
MNDTHSLNEYLNNIQGLIALISLIVTIIIAIISFFMNKTVSQIKINQKNIHNGNIISGDKSQQNITHSGTGDVAGRDMTK